MPDPWDGRLEDEAATETTEPEEVVEEPDEPDAGTDESSEDDAEAPSEAPLIFGKYKTLEEAEKGHKELERFLHSQTQQQEEPEEEEEEYDDSPISAMFYGGSLDSDDAQRLINLAAEGPDEARQAFEWLQENGDQFGMIKQQLTDHVYSLWFQQAPLAVRALEREQDRAQMLEQLQERQAPLDRAHEAQMQQVAWDRAVHQIPGFEKYWPQINERILSREAQSIIQADPSYRSDPDKMFNLLQSAAQIVVYQEYVENQRLAAAEPQGSGTPAKKPRTQQRSSVAPPATGGVEDLFPPGTFRTG